MFSKSCHRLMLMLEMQETTICFKKHSRHIQINATNLWKKPKLWSFFPSLDIMWSYSRCSSRVTGHNVDVVPHVCKLCTLCFFCLLVFIFEWTHIMVSSQGSWSLRRCFRQPFPPRFECRHPDLRGLCGILRLACDKKTSVGFIENTCKNHLLDFRL